MFAYCGNNPTYRADQSGEFWNIAIGAAVGAAINGGISLLSQWIGSGWKNINWRRVGLAVATGAISGALAATGIPAVGQIFANGLLGVASAGADTYLESAGTASFSQYIDNMALGGFLGLVGGAFGGGGAGTTHLSNHAGKFISKSFDALRGLNNNGLKATTKAIANAGRYYYSQIATASFQAGKAAVMPIALSNIPNAINSVLQVFQK